MCLGVPGRIIETSESLDVAIVEVEGVTRTINVSLLGDTPLAPGDWVLIHLGFALEKLNAQELADIQSALDLLGADDAAFAQAGTSGAPPR